MSFLKYKRNSTRKYINNKFNYNVMSIIKDINISISNCCWVNILLDEQILFEFFLFWISIFFLYYEWSVLLFWKSSWCWTCFCLFALEDSHLKNLWSFKVFIFGWMMDWQTVKHQLNSLQQQHDSDQKSWFMKWMDGWHNEPNL